MLSKHTREIIAQRKARQLQARLEDIAEKVLIVTLLFVATVIFFDQILRAVNY